MSRCYMLRIRGHMMTTCDVGERRMQGTSCWWLRVPVKYCRDERDFSGLNMLEMLATGGFRVFQQAVQRHSAVPLHALAQLLQATTRQQPVASLTLRSRPLSICVSFRSVNSCWQQAIASSP